MRSKSKVRSRIGQMEKNDGTLTVSNKETVEVLNLFFKSVFTVENTATIPDFPAKVSSVLNDICITESDV